MHGRRRHPSRCTAPFKQLNDSDYMSSDYKGTRTDAQAKEYMASLASKYGQHGPKLDIPETPQETISQEKVDHSAKLTSYDIKKRSDEIKLEDARKNPTGPTGVIQKIIADPETSTIQKVQTGLTGLELLAGHPAAEAVSTIAGGVNATISTLRGGYHLIKGEDEAAKSNFIDAGMSGWGMFPYGGYVSTLAKVARMEKMYDASKVVDKTVDVVGKARHGQHVPTMVTGGSAKTGSVLNPELTGGGFGKGSDFQKSFTGKNPIK